MAGYKTHLSVGAVVGLAFAVLTIVWGWIAGLVQTAIIFVITFVGAFLPDMDSESGKPVKVIFTSYALIASGMTLFFLVDSSEEELLLLLLLPLLVFAIVRFIMPLVFNKLTTHRGMFHSMPAALVAFAIVYFGAGIFDCTIKARFAFAMAAFVGYVSHLLLDEVFSTQILSGEFKPKKSLGTAMKFFSKDKLDNIIAYSILLLSVFVNLFLEILKRNAKG